MFKRYAGVFALAIFLAVAGCAGGAPKLIPQYQVGDESLSCSQIKQELADNQVKVAALLPKTDKTGKNVGLGVAGAFLLVPWFFMDFSDRERREVESYLLRDNRLHILADQKRCNDMPARMKAN